MAVELVTPPWDLCGFDRDFDPYSWPEERRFVVQWAWNGGPFGPAEMSVRPAQDPNARDGEWRELVFMPHRAAYPLVELWPDTEHLRRAGVRSDRPVPEYLSVAEALRL